MVWFYSSFCATYSNIVIIRYLPSLLAVRVMTLDRKWFSCMVSTLTRLALTERHMAPAALMLEAPPKNR